ncbi:MAG: hypothetical protein ACRDRE_17565 [Pseudonocardiaceae bacterium]
MLDESDYSAAIGRELLIVTADLGIESAWYTHDADQQTLARQLSGEAALLADSAGDSPQRVQLYANMAQQYSYLARHTGGRGLAQQALQFAGRAVDACPSRALPGATRFRLAAPRRRARATG